MKVAGKNPDCQKVFITNFVLIYNLSMNIAFILKSYLYEEINIEVSSN